MPFSEIARFSTVVASKCANDVAGEYDYLPEQAFLMVGSIEGAVENGKRMAQAA